MYRNILVAIDIAAPERARRIISRAKQLLDEGGTIVLLTVVEELPEYIISEIPPDFSAAAHRDTEARLVQLRERNGVTAEIEVRHGGPAREILAAAEARNVDLVILASHRPDLSNYFLGATADRVVRHAQCSVLVDR